MRNTLPAGAFLRVTERANWAPPFVAVEVLRRAYSIEDIAKRAPTLRGISGHAIGHSALSVLSDAPAITVMIMREPIDRLISWYNFRSMRDIHRGFGVVPLDVAMDALPSNPMASFLLNRWCEYSWFDLAGKSLDQRKAILDEKLGEIDLITDIGATGMVFDLMAKTFDLPRREPKKNTLESWMRRVDWQPITKEDLSEGLREKLIQKTRLDHYLWERWAMKKDVVFDGQAHPMPWNADLKRVHSEIRRQWYRKNGQKRLGET